MASEFNEKTDSAYWNGACIQAVFRTTVLNREAEDHIHPWTVTNTYHRCRKEPGSSDVAWRYFGVTQFFFTATIFERERSFAVVKWFTTPSSDLGKTYPPSIDLKFSHDDIIPVTQIDSRVLMVPFRKKVQILATCY